MDLNLLPLFHAVAEARSFSQAARRLALPKSSVSRGVAALEASVGAQLLQRTTRSVALTAEGSALYRDTAPLLSRLSQALDQAPRGEREPKGVLRITASTDLGAVLMGAALPRFVASHPRLRVDLRLTNRVVDLVGEGFDAAVRASARPLADSSLIARKLSNTEMQFFASPDYLQRRAPRSFDDLLALDWVTFPRWRPPPPLRKLPPARLVGDDFFFIREALRAGAGVGMLPVFLAAQDARAGTLERVLPQWSETRGMLSLVYPQTKQLPRKLEVFREFLTRWLTENPL